MAVSIFFLTIKYILDVFNDFPIKEYIKNGKAHKISVIESLKRTRCYKLYIIKLILMTLIKIIFFIYSIKNIDYSCEEIALSYCNCIYSPFINRTDYYNYYFNRTIIGNITTLSKILIIILIIGIASMVSVR